MKQTINFLTNRTTAYLLSFVVLLIFATSCSNNLEQNISPENQKAIKIQVASDRTSYTLENGQPSYEANIENITTLVFDKELNFVYKAATSKPKYTTKNIYEFDVVVNLLKDNENYQLVFLANLDDQNINLSRYVGQPKQVVLDLYQFERNMAKEQSNVPMYGQSEYTTIKATSKIETISMMRAISKVDFFLTKNNFDGSTGDLKEGNAVNYEIEEIHVFNTPKIGRVAPRFEQTVPFNWASFIPREASMVDKTTYNKSHKYEYGGTKNTTAEFPIYVPENIGGSSSNNRYVTAFVLGLRKNENGSTLPLRYYRVDLQDGETIKPIIRNKHYQLLIEDINIDGSESIEDALASTATCDVTLSVKDWKVKKQNWDIVGSEYFDIASRSVFMPKAETQTITFKSNIHRSDIRIAWAVDAPENVKQKFIKSDSHTVSIVPASEDLNDYNYNLEIQTLKDYAPNLQNVITKFYIFAGNMVVPMEIQQKTPTVEMIGTSPMTKALPQGAFVANTEVKKSAYMEFRIPAEFTYQNDKTKDFETLKLEIGDYVNVSGEDTSTSNLKFNLENYLLNYNDFKTVKEEDLEGNLVDVRYVIVKVPASGKPNIFSSVDKTPKIKLEYKIKKKYSDFNSVHPNLVEIETYRNEPEFEYTPKILIIGESYSVKPSTIYNSISSYFYDVNLARILYNNRVFGLEDVSKVKVEPYLYSAIVNGKFEKNLTRNIERYDSFTDIGNPSYLNEFDIILYLNSGVTDELYKKNNVYANTIVKLLKKKQIVFIQTPSRESAIQTTILGNSYNDPILRQLMDLNEDFSVFQSSKNTQMALGLEPKKTLKDEWLTNYPEIKSTSNTLMFFPSRDKKSILRYANVFATFRDTHYIKWDASNSILINKHFEVVTHDSFGETNNCPTALKSKNYDYIWLGNTSIFADSALGMEGKEIINYQPGVFEADTFVGYETGHFFKKATYNSFYFVGMMHWAMKQANKNAPNKPKNKNN